MLDTDMNMMLFSFIMMRMAGCILMNPIFGRTNIPISVKSGMIFTFTLLVYSVSGRLAALLLTTRWGFPCQRFTTHRAIPPYP